MANHSTVDPSGRTNIGRSLELKLDLRCTMSGLIYFMNYPDRNNTAACLRGFETGFQLNNT